MLEEKAKELRNTVLEMCIKAGTGHVTSCFSCIEIMVALWYKVMKPEDKFILSKGHASPLMYAILADKGYIDREELWKFAQKDGMLGVHLDGSVNGAIITAGSLGHGVSIGCGLALAKKLNNEGGNVYILVGDGECYEGSVWEAAMFAGNQRLDNLVAIVDYNRLMVTGKTELAPFMEKWHAFGWFAHLVDGHHFTDYDQIKYKVEKARIPNVFVASTTKGKGIPFMENVALWHGLAPQGEDAERARRELND